MSPSARSVLLGAALLEAGHGGIARVARMTAAALIEAGHDVEMLSLLDAQPLRIGQRTSRTAHGSKLSFSARCHWEALSRSHFIYDSAGIARAHTHLPGLRRPYAVWMHGIEVWDALRPAAKTALIGARLRIANSKYTLDRYRSLHGDLLATQVCWLATEQDEPPELAPSFLGPPTVMILARIDDGEGYKGHAELIGCWPQVVSAVPDARLMIAGGGPGLARLKESVRTSPVAAKIICTGFVEEAGVGDLWRKAHVFAMPSRGEGFGIVYAEAMRHGLPVIASIHDAGPEINVHNETGFNVDLDRNGDLAARLIELLRSPKAAQYMGRAGQNRWRSHFRRSAFDKRLLPILTEFLESDV